MVSCIHLIFLLIDLGLADGLLKNSLFGNLLVLLVGFRSFNYSLQEPCKYFVTV